LNTTGIIEASTLESSLDTGKDCCIIKVREKGNRIIVRISKKATILQLKAEIIKLENIPHKTANLQLRTAFPNRIFDNDEDTLENLSLYPKATVIARFL